jgi:hypothetical protein
MNGYLHPDYIQSLSEFGEPLQLLESGGWLLRRSIDGVAADAMGPYPLFSCANWQALEHDLGQVGTSLVTAILVTDPFGNYDEPLLRDCFGDRVAPFKSHFVTDLGYSLKDTVCDHHARNARLGLRQLCVERCENASAHLDDWTNLYSVLAQRHGITGMRAFSRNSFAIQMKIPGLVCFRAFRDQETVGMILWFIQNSVAYYHLGAYTDEGYRLRASFALFREALEYFAAAGLKYASLGAGAGLDGAGEDGLSRFKRGWSTGVRTTYLCGRVFDRLKYEDLVSKRAIETADYFPAYRKGEFN